MNRNKHCDVLMNKIFKIPFNYSALSFLKLLGNICKYTGNLDSYNLFTTELDPEHIYLFRHSLIKISSKKYERQTEKILKIFGQSYRGGFGYSLFDSKHVELSYKNYSIRISTCDPLRLILFKHNGDINRVSYDYLTTGWLDDIQKNIKFIMDVIKNDKLRNLKFNNLISDISQHSSHNLIFFEIDKFIKYESKTKSFYLPSNYDKNIKLDETILKLLFILYNQLDKSDKIFRCYGAGPLIITIHPQEYVCFSIIGISFNKTYRRFEDMEEEIKRIFLYLIEEYAGKKNKLFDLKREIMLT